MLNAHACLDGTGRTGWSLNTFVCHWMLCHRCRLYLNAIRSNRSTPCFLEVQGNLDYRCLIKLDLFLHLRCSKSLTDTKRLMQTTQKHTQRLLSVWWDQTWETNNFNLTGTCTTYKRSLKRSCYMCYRCVQKTSTSRYQRSNFHEAMNWCLQSHSRTFSKPEF